VRCRIARLVLFAFIAGPALNVECLVSCAPKEIAASGGECHRTAHADAAFGSQQGCRDLQAHVVPFVKSSGLPVLVAVPASRTSDVIERIIVRPIPVRVPATGPPGILAVVPLRI
jgi:hypothetical protein